MAATTRTIGLLKALKAQLETISTASGFHTDAGQRVYVLRTDVDEETDTFPLLLLNYREEVIGRSAGPDHEIRLHALISGYVLRQDNTDPLDALEHIEQIKEDVQKAVVLDALSAFAGPGQPEAFEPDPVADSSRLLGLHARYSFDFSAVFGS